MSLIPYTEDSLILNDPHSKSLVIVNPTQGKLSVFQEIVDSEQIQHDGSNTSPFFDFRGTNPNRNNNSINHSSRTSANINGINNHFISERKSTGNRNRPIATFICPNCGYEISDRNESFLQGRRASFSNGGRRNPNIGLPQSRFNDMNVEDPLEFNYNYNDTKEEGNDNNNHNILPHFTLSPKYFQLLQNTHRHYSLPNIPDNVLINASNETSKEESQDFKSFIPEDLFIPGYFHKFFTTLSLLGNGARGSVFKVVHKIGNTPLGVFALKKISIGNDMVWFNKCIREVKALSSLTHKSANLITYNHVWLEMDESYGVTTKDKDMPGLGSSEGNTDDIDTHEENEKIPCLFILQQYCPGGNLEDCILVDVFRKFPEKISPEERKKWFRQMREMKKSKTQIELGLSTRQILHILRDITRGLHELHDIGLIHRDLKPSNCLLLSKYRGSEDMFNDAHSSEDKNEYGSSSNENEVLLEQPFEQESKKEDDTEDSFPTIVVGDLGESQLIGEARTATGSTGTLEYTAPEVVITNNHINLNGELGLFPHYNEYTFASDMYSLGMIAYFIVFGKLPFVTNSLDFPEMKNMVKRFRIDKSAMIQEHDRMNLKKIDLRIFDVIESLLSVDPNYRPSAKNLEDYIEHLLLDLNISSSNNISGAKRGTKSLGNNSIFTSTNATEVMKNEGKNVVMDPTIISRSNDLFNEEEDEVSSIDTEISLIRGTTNTTEYDVSLLHSGDESIPKERQYLALTDSNQTKMDPMSKRNKFVWELSNSVSLQRIISLSLASLIYYINQERFITTPLNLLMMFVLGLSFNGSINETKKISLFLFLLLIISRFISL